MSWYVGAEQIVSMRPQGHRPGGLDRPPILAPAEGSTAHAVDDQDHEPACGTDASLVPTRSVAWPPPDPRIIACPDCLDAIAATTDGG